MCDLIELAICDRDPKDEEGSKVSICGGSSLTVTCLADSKRGFTERGVSATPLNDCHFSNPGGHSAFSGFGTGCNGGGSGGRIGTTGFALASIAGAGGAALDEDEDFGGGGAGALDPRLPEDAKLPRTSCCVADAAFVNAADLPANDSSHSSRAMCSATAFARAFSLLPPPPLGRCRRFGTLASWSGLSPASLMH